MEHYFAILTEKDILLPVYVAGMGTDDHQQWRTREKDFPYYQLAYCEKGSGIFVADNKEYKIEPGTFFFFSAHVPHMYYPTAEPWCLHWILFSGANVEALIQAVGIKCYDVFHLTNPSTYFRCINDIKNIISRNYPTEVVEISGVLYHFLVNIKSQIQYPGTSPTDITSKKVEDVTKYIDTHFREDISLCELAGCIRVSESYLCRIFHAAYGESPLTYVIRYKINEAKKQLIEYPDKKIKEIASEIGFHDQSYFGATFKRYEGCTPKQFRNMFFDRI